jgi:hypothetical protein
MQDASKMQATVTGDREGARQRIKSCATLSRLAASGGFRNVMQQHGRTVHSALYTAQGKASFFRWEMQHDDVLELREALLTDAGLYDEVDF